MKTRKHPPRAFLPPLLFLLFSSLASQAEIPTFDPKTTDKYDPIFKKSYIRICFQLKAQQGELKPKQVVDGWTIQCMPPQNVSEECWQGEGLKCRFPDLEMQLIFKEEEICLSEPPVRASTDCPPPVAAKNLTFWALFDHTRVHGRAEAFPQKNALLGLDKEGSSFGLALQWAISNRVSLEAGYTTFDFDSTLIAEEGYTPFDLENDMPTIIVEGQGKPIDLESALTLDAKYYFTDLPTSFFLSGGLGLYGFDSASGELGYQLGLGYQHELSRRLALSVEARQLFTHTASQNIDFTSVRVGLGLRF